MSDGPRWTLADDDPWWLVMMTEEERVLRALGIKFYIGILSRCGQYFLLEGDIGAVPMQMTVKRKLPKFEAPAISGAKGLVIGQSVRLP